MPNLRNRTHKEILLEFLDDERWHSMPELMKRFQDLKGGAYWSGLRSRASELRKNYDIRSRKHAKGYAEYQLIK